MRLIIRKSDSTPEEIRQSSRELLSIMAMRKALIRNHNKKINDRFRQIELLIVLALVELASFIAIGLTGGWDTLYILLTGVVSVTLIMEVAVLISLYSTLSKLTNSHEDSTILDIDENGIAITRENGSSVRGSWQSILFVKTYKYTVVFMARDISSVTFSVSRKYRDEIYAYLKENVPEVLILDP